MIAMGHHIRVQNDQKISLPHNEPQIPPVFVQKQPPEIFLKISQILQKNTCVGVSFRPATLLESDS